jgi:hypothetical protein
LSLRLERVAHAKLLLTKADSLMKVTLLARRSVLCLAVLLTPGLAAAGGNEFPADGTRNLGRGGTGLTRADDPNVMVRNPALLADLWTSMASSGVHLVLAGSCFQATGSYGWNVRNAGVVRFGDGPLVTNVSGATTPDGQPLPDLGNEAFPKVCYQGPSPMVVPAIGLALKLGPQWGLGIGFFPPESAALGQWGSRDGTVHTPDGLRPSPTRWLQAHLNSSYVSALAALGYRPLDWLRVGVGLQCAWMSMPAICSFLALWRRCRRIRSRPWTLRSGFAGRIA